MASFSDLQGELTKIAVVADQGAEAAANAMADVFRKAVRTELGEVGHPLHTKTPKPPGSSPAWISMNLRNSMFNEPAHGGGGTWVSRSGPTVRYARVQELGGWMKAHTSFGMRWQEPPGVWHRSFKHWLPKRPYMKPVHDELVADGTLADAAAAAFAEWVYPAE